MYIYFEQDRIPNLKKIIKRSTMSFEFVNLRCQIEQFGYINSFIQNQTFPKYYKYQKISRYAK